MLCEAKTDTRQKRLATASLSLIVVTRCADQEYLLAINSFMLRVDIRTPLIGCVVSVISRYICSMRKNLDVIVCRNIDT